MDDIGTQHPHPATPVQTAGEVPVEVHLPLGSEIECVHGQLWFTVRPLGGRRYVDDKCLVPGERFLAPQALTVRVSGVRGRPAGYRVRLGVHAR